MYSGAWLIAQPWRTDHQVTTSQIRTRFDDSAGQSGSPIYHCYGISGCPGTTEEIAGLIAGCSAAGSHRVRGPNFERLGPFVAAYIFGN